MSCEDIYLLSPLYQWSLFATCFFPKTCQNGVKQQHGSLPPKNGNSYTPNTAEFVNLVSFLDGGLALCAGIPILHYPTRWAPTIVINGVITPIKGLRNG